MFKPPPSSNPRAAWGGGPTVSASTEPGAVGRKAPAGGAEVTATTHRYNAEARTFEFLSPVMLSGRTIGFVKADYAREVIYEPYFRTQVKVFDLTGKFVREVEFPGIGTASGFSGKRKDQTREEMRTMRFKGAQGRGEMGTIPVEGLNFGNAHLCRSNFSPLLRQV
jgi:hypothetical protein